MDVTRLEQRAYIKIAVLRGRNARGCHIEVVEAVGTHMHLCVSMALCVITVELSPIHIHILWYHHLNVGEE